MRLAIELAVSRVFGVETQKIVHANRGVARVALARQVEATNTVARIKRAGALMNISPEDVAASLEGFNFIQLLRLRHQHQVLGQAGGGNRIDPDALNELDRHILKEAFKQARKLQDKLKLDYRL